MSKVFGAVMIVLLLSTVLSSCGGKLNETYTMTTLREATRGNLLSPGFKYSFDTPKFVAAHKDLALVREGNLIELFMGDKLEDHIKQIEGKKFVLGARKMFTPYIHFVVDFMVADGDTIRVGPSYEMKPPTLLKAKEFPTDNYEEVDLDALTSNRLRLKVIQNTKFKVKMASLGYDEVNITGEPEMVYTINLKKVRFLVKDPTDGMQLIFKALMNEHLYFDGGVDYGRIPPRSFRKKTNSGGFVTVEYVKYGGMVITSQK